MGSCFYIESESEPMFAYTCQHGTVAEVKAALKRGADINAQTVNETGLMMAVASKNNSVVALLLNTPNIDVNWKDNGIKGAGVHCWRL